MPVRHRLPFRCGTERARVSVVVLTLALAGAVGAAQSLPANWREVTTTGQDERLFEAGGLPAGESASVRVSSRRDRGNQPLRSWTATAIASDVAPVGAWAGEAVITPRNGQLVTATREFAVGTGPRGIALYFAVGRDASHARLFRSVFSSVAAGRGPQGTAAQDLVSGLMRAELSGELRTDARPDSRATAPAAAAPTADAPTAPSTAANAGLRSDQIETVYYHWDQRYDAFQGLVMDEAVYLLLKDGTAYDGFLVPPADFDVAAARRRDPKHWGKWRREGTGYALAWPPAMNEFSVPRGNPVPPGRAGLRLQGRFSGSTSYTLPGGGTSTWSEFSITFTTDGRFEHSVTGGAGTTSGSATTVTTYDDDRATSTSTTGSAVIAGQSRRGDASDRRGLYQIEGYAIVLRYDSGRVERHPFFVDDGGAGVWFNGTRLARAR